MEAGLWWFMPLIPAPEMQGQQISVFKDSHVNKASFRTARPELHKREECHRERFEKCLHSMLVLTGWAQN